MKKSSERLSLELVRNPDTLATIAARSDAPFTVGFAAETNDVAAYATDKMKRKKLAMIVANDVSAPGIGFNSDQNAVTVFWSGGQRAIGPAPKSEIARELVALVAAQMLAQP
jgi:phosphopantothenoylcysteine decarboxylase/phosphopantothenate--cysteine ligase